MDEDIGAAFLNDKAKPMLVIEPYAYPVDSCRGISSQLTRMQNRQSPMKSGKTPSVQMQRESTG